MLMNRPLGVAFLAIAAALIGLVEMLRSFLSFASVIIDFLFGIHFPGGTAFPLRLLIGMVWLLTSYWFWKGAKIGWALGIVVAVLVAILNFPVGTMLGGLVIVYLVVPEGVRKWFSRQGVW